VRTGLLDQLLETQVRIERLPEPPEPHRMSVRCGSDIAVSGATRMTCSPGRPRPSAPAGSSPRAPDLGVGTRRRCTRRAGHSLSLGRDAPAEGAEGLPVVRRLRIEADGLSPPTCGRGWRTVLVSASDPPRAGHVALDRSVSGSILARAGAPPGLREWFDGNNGVARRDRPRGCLRHGRRPALLVRGWRPLAGAGHRPSRGSS
jgi:hypothetical protein